MNVENAELCEDRNFVFTLEVTVHDTAALLEAAVAHARKEGLSEQEIAEYGLRDEEGNIDPRWCLQMLLDPGLSPPGCEIQHSGAEEVSE